GAAGPPQLAHRREDPDRVGDVVQHLDGHDQVGVAGDRGRCSAAARVPQLEAHPVADAGVGRVLAGCGDGGLVEVDAVDGGVRVRLGDGDGGDALAAPDLDD